MDSNLLIVGDSAQGVQVVEDGSIKLVYGSPPYPNARRNYGYWTGDEWLTMMKRHFEALVPKVSDDGFLVVNVKSCREEAPEGQNSYRRRWVERFLIWVEDTLPLFAVDDEIWHKGNCAPTGLRAASQDAWEPIYVWARRNPWTWNLDSIRREYDQETIERYERSVFRPRKNGLGYISKEKKFEANEMGALPRNVITCGVAPPSDELLHQARQPETLPERYIKAFSNRGDLVWDPWMGSGTTGVVAFKLGRRFGGTDVLEENVNVVLKRLYPAFGA